MGKNKLKKFSDMDTFPHVFQFPYAAMADQSIEIKGNWGKTFFKNDNPIVLELGCGKGEYCIGLARLYPEKNFIGVDVKGARMWTGAKQSLEEGLPNVAFLRTDIELIDSFFAENEVAEIWITFPDPQMKKCRKRLTSTRFTKLYSQILNPNGVVHLKTDSNFLFTYTKLMVQENNYPVLVCTDDLYHSDLVDPILSIKTFYEQQWLERGLNIKYIKFVCEPKEYLIEPEHDIEHDDYRSYNHSKRGNPTKKEK